MNCVVSNVAMTDSLDHKCGCVLLVLYFEVTKIIRPFSCNIFFVVLPSHLIKLYIAYITSAKIINRHEYSISGFYASVNASENTYVNVGVLDRDRGHLKDDNLCSPFTWHMIVYFWTNIEQVSHKFL